MYFVFLSGTLTVEEVYKDRDQFASLVREVAAPDVGRMGIEILSFTIKDVYDNVTYLASLGKNHRHLRIRMNHKTYIRHLKISKSSFTLKNLKLKKRQKENVIYSGHLYTRRLKL